MSRAVDVAALLVQRFEGFRSKPYLCPAGVPTIGWGFTHYGNGRLVTLADPEMTMYQADSFLQELLKGLAVTTMRLCPAIKNAEGLGAITDFAYNLGVPRLAGSTLRKRINAGDTVAAVAELRKWVHGGGRILPGLVRRREAEIDYFTEG